jgi:hypothetical protein
MQLERRSYHHGRGWSEPLPELDSPRTLVLGFASPRFRSGDSPWAELLRRYPTSHHIGCSTAGEIHGAAVHDDSLSLAIVRFERASLRSAIASVADGDGSFAAGEEIARQLVAEPDLRAVFVLCDGTKVNGSRLVDGLNRIVPAGVVVTGGLAGDGDRFHSTWSLDHGLPRAGIVGAVGLYGDSLRIGHSSRGGWDIFGPERRITRSSGNVLFELDGRPALALYKEYLGERAKGLPATGLLFPLALRGRSADHEQIVRTILAVDEAAQSMTFAGDVPEGSLAQLMRANFDRLVDGAGAAAQGVAAAGNGPTLAIAISCVGRRLVLGERVDEEVEATLAALPQGTEQVGFYSYGELSPQGSGSCALHNQTMTLTTIAEHGPA